MGGSQDNFKKTSSPVALLHIFVSSSSHLLPSLPVGPPCSTRKNPEKEKEKDSMVHFYLDPNNGMDQTGWGYEKDLRQRVPSVC